MDTTSETRLSLLRRLLAWFRTAPTVEPLPTFASTNPRKADVIPFRPRNPSFYKPVGQSDCGNGQITWLNPRQ